MQCLILLACLFGISYAGPLHASCKVDWSFTSSCDVIKTSLKDQINTWSTADNCANGGEKCLYMFKSEDATTLKLVHETPVHHYKDDVTFTFAQSGTTCNVHGFSTSQTWYAILDSGTNYCNMKNLIEGANLHNTLGFTETTSDSKCTQYSSADCMKY